MIINTDDKNATYRDYEHLKEDELLVSSVFYTIQGEGPLMGMPAIFVRLAGCNHGMKSDFCRFCDTSFELHKGQIRKYDSLVEQIHDIWRAACPDIKTKLVVITGGEPTLQKNLVKFVEDYLSTDKDTFIQIESNGEFYLELPFKDRTMLVVSPKANEKSGKYAKLNTFAASSCEALKVLISADTNSPYNKLPPYLSLDDVKQDNNFHNTREDSLPGYNIKDLRKKVWLSPICVYTSLDNKNENGINKTKSVWTGDCYNREASEANYRYAANLCIKYGFRLSLQTHILVGIL